MTKKILLLIFCIFFLTACSAKEKLVVGMDLQYPPFETVDVNNKPYGISVDIAKEFGKYIDKEIEIVNTDFSSIIPAIESGEIDIAIASVSITEERAKKVDFSDPYAYFKVIGLVNKDYAQKNNITSESKIESIINNKETRFIGLASQISTSIPEKYGFEVVEATEKSTAVLSVSQGTADVLLMSAEVVAAANKANQGSTIVVWDSIESSPVGMVVKKGESKLLKDANDFIANMPTSFNSQLKKDWDAVIRDILNDYGIEFYLNE